MAFLVGQIALCLLATGLLGLLLGWWLGRSSAGARLADAEEGWERRLLAIEDENRGLQAREEELDNELATARGDLERANQRAAKVAVNLSESERLLAEERQQGEREVEERDAEIGALRGEIERWRRERADLDAARRQTDEDLDRLSDELARSRERIAELEAAVARGRHQIAEFERSRTPDADLGPLRLELDRLRKVKAEFQEWMLGEAKREEEARHLRHQLERATTERDAVAEEIGHLRSRLAGADAAPSEETESLREELSRRSARIADLEAHIASRAGLEEEVEQLRSAAESGGEQSRELEEQLREAIQRAERAETAREQARGELEALLEARLVDIDGTPATSKAEQPVPGEGPELLEAPEGERDDLKKIRGIGQVLEATLNELGVYHYRQIASWSPSNIDWVASHLGTFPDRIERDEWLAQAAELDRSREGEEG